MPPRLVPHRSGVHRAACFALFRALLRQKNVLPLKESQRAALQSNIKAAFKKNAHSVSPPKVIAALQLGYQTLQAFHRFDKQSDELRRILEPIFPITSTKQSALLPMIDATQAPSEERMISKSRAKNRRPWSRDFAHSDQKPVLSRPFLNLTGRRHVPKLGQSNGIPFLRIKKPQPPKLSRFIRDHVISNDKRTRQMQALHAQIKIEHTEDEWDLTLKAVCGLRIESSEESWTTESKLALTKMWNVKINRSKQALMMAARMQKIIEKEQALADEERASRRSDRDAQKKLRYLTRRELE